MKPAFSTVACPTWTFRRVVEEAEKWGFAGVELRSFGTGGTQLACEPTQTDARKLRGMFERAGCEIISVGTSVAFDEPVTPPVIGYVIGDPERTVREAQAAIDTAVALECPFVRVFGHELVGNESRKSGVARVASRLAKAADYARNSGVRIMLENGGTFTRAVDLAEIIDQVDHPLVCAAYSAPVGEQAGERMAEAANILGDRLVCVKLRDFKNGLPCALGEGDFQNRQAVEDLARAGYTGWIVYEYDRLWFPEAAPAEEVMPKSARTLFTWVGNTRPNIHRRGVAIA